MGLGGILKNIGQGLLGLVPGGGTINKVLDLASSAAPVLGGMASGRAAGKQAENQEAQTQDQLRQRMWEAQTQNILQRSRLMQDQATMQRDSPTIRAQQAARGDMQANIQDVNIPGNERLKVQHFSGGMRPSAMGSNARAAGAGLSSIALQNMGKDSFEVPNLPAPPDLTALQKSGFLDKLLSGASGAAGLLGAFAPDPNDPMQPKQPTPPGQVTFPPGSIRF